LYNLYKKFKKIIFKLINDIKLIFYPIQEVELWTDGSYSHQSKVGAWAYIINIDNKYTTKAQAKHINIYNDCSERMEFMAILSGLRFLNKIPKKMQINVYSDCQSLLKGIQNINRFKRGKWSANRVKPHKDLWVNLYRLLKETKHEINFVWIRGHRGIGLNNNVDKVANRARKKLEKSIKENSVQITMEKEMEKI